MPADDCSVWVLTGKELQHFDDDGVQTKSLSLQSLGKNLEDADLLAADPSDGSVWLAKRASLVHVSADGKLIGSYALPVPVEQLAVAQDSSVWLYGAQHIVHVAPNGALLASRPLGLRGFTLAGRLVVDSLGDRLWLAGVGRVQQFQMSKLSKAPLEIPVIPVIQDMTFDPVSGRVWLLTANHHLLEFDRSGKLIQDRPIPPASLFDTRQLQFDVANQSLWVVGNKEIERRTGEGVPQSRLMTSPPITAFATPPFGVRAALTLETPSAGAALNQPRPRIGFGYQLMCGKAPCPPAANDSNNASFTLDATLNGTTISAVLDTAGGKASYTPATALPDGTIAVRARARDAFGHLSNAVEGMFTIDTVPPVFVSLQPADGSVLQSASVTVSGAVDDPSAMVVLEEAGKWNGTGVNPAQQNFSFGVTLKSGVNTLAISAVDVAGNVAVTRPTYTFGTLSVDFTLPATEITVDSDTVKVQGIFRGPAGTVLTIMCGALDITGEHFSADGIPLAYGRNPITATATDPSGNTVSKTIYVNSTIPSVSVTAPIAGVPVISHGVVVRGAIQAPQGSQVLVNGVAASINGSSFQATTPLVFGPNPVEVRVIAPGGKAAMRAFSVESGLPSVRVAAPADQSVVPVSAVTVSGSFHGPASTTITANGLPAVISGKTFFVNGVPLRYGSNMLAIQSSAPNLPTVTKRVNVESSAPEIRIAYPSPGMTLSIGVAQMSGSVFAPPGSTLTVNGLVVPFSGTAFSTEVPLKYGPNAIDVRVTTPANVVGSAVLNVNTTAPSITIDTPLDNSRLPLSRIDIAGSFGASGPVQIYIGGRGASVSGNRFTLAGHPLFNGLNTVRAEMYAGNERVTSTVSVTRIAPSIVVTAPANLSSVDAASVALKGSYVGAVGSLIELKGPGFGSIFLRPEEMAGGAFAVDAVPLVFGQNLLSVKLWGPDGQVTTTTVNVSSSSNRPTVFITSARGGDSTVDSSIYVGGKVVAPEGSAVTVNGIDAGLDEGRFGLDNVALVPGPNKLVATLVTPDGASYVHEIEVTRAPAKLTIVGPLNGASVAADRVLVTGTVSGPRNSGVTVNGSVALVDRFGNFYANNVALAPGANTLQVTTTSADGRHVSASIEVLSVRQSDLVAAASVMRGVAPLTVNFTVDGLNGANVGSFEVMPNGPGAPATAPANTFGFTYSQPGLYQAEVNMTASTGVWTTQKIAILVEDPYVSDAQFDAIWSGMNLAMVRGDVAAAQGYLTYSAKKRYGPVLAAIQPRYEELSATFSPLMRSRIMDGLAEYAIVRPDAGGTRQVHLIYFVQDADGVWRLDSM